MLLIPRSNLILLSNAMRSDSSKALFKESIGLECVTWAKVSLGMPPTLWVGESEVTNDGLADSISTNSRKRTS